MNKSRICLLLSFLLFLNVSNNSFSFKSLFRKKRETQRRSPIKKFNCFILGENGLNRLEIYQDTTPCPVVVQRDKFEYVRFSPDGMLIFFVSEENLHSIMSINIVCSRMLTRIHKTTFLGRKVKNLAFSADGTVIACAMSFLRKHHVEIHYHSGIALEFEDLSDKILMVPSGHYLADLCFQNGETEFLWAVLDFDLVVGGAAVCCWDIASGAMNRFEQIKGYLANPKKIFCNDREIFVAGIGRSGKKIKIINLTKGRLIKKIRGYNKKISVFDFLPDSACLYHFTGDPRSTKRKIMTYHFETNEERLLGEFNLEPKKKLLALSMASGINQEGSLEAEDESISDEQVRISFLCERANLMPNAIRVHAIEVPRFFLLQ